MVMLNNLVNKMVAWIDAIFGWFGFYSMKATKGLVWALLLFLIGLFMKVNIKVGHKK
jgi:hypothetical protein